MKKRIFTIIQIALAITILALLFSRIDKSELLAVLSRTAENWPLIISALITTLVCLCICTLRWKILLGTIGLKLSFSRMLTLYFVGHFFNAFMPGVVGGDLPKAFYVAKETHHKKTEVVSTVFIDRIIGLIALIALSTVIMICNLNFFLSNNYTKIALLFNCALLGGCVMGLFLVFQRNIFEQFALFRKFEERTSAGKILSRAYNSFRTCLYSPAVLVKTLGLSLINHTLMISIAFQVGKALGIQIRFLDYLVVFPTINAAAALPITPSGWGIKEGVAKYLLGAMNVPETMAIPLSALTTMLLLFWSVVGGIVYILYSLKAGRIDLKSELENDDV